MSVITNELALWKPAKDTFLTIGVFDGVHLGHQHLIKELKRRADAEDVLSVVVTFNQHPRSVLGRQAALPYLTNGKDRAQLLQGLGVDRVITLPFTTEVAQLTAKQFVDLLREHLRMRGLVIGPDFALGRDREGNADLLGRLAVKGNFRVHVVAPLVLDGQVVSSTAIRQALAEGDMASVAKWLGRPFSLRGKVVAGKRRGQLLGFPTANLAVNPQHACPADGVYVVLAYFDGKVLGGVTNIGTRPTFEDGPRTVEVHLLDFQGELYGREMRIELLRRLRPELKFATAEELVTQMRRDVAQARAFLEA
ncbi:MAG: bifunctional riboflavin kinase/FAD synthetase [Chloroflexi bacterium]|nr:bifunctional riboflavin kinase/FAD synthetase [Chloroflexota bacterium]